MPVNAFLIFITCSILKKTVNHIRIKKIIEDYQIKMHYKFILITLVKVKINSKILVGCVIHQKNYM